MNSATGTFSLTFASVLDSISLDEAFVRFQAVSGVVSGFEFDDDSGAGITNGVVINPLVIGETPLPAAVWLFGGVLGVAGMIAGGRRRKQKSAWDVTQNA